MLMGGAILCGAIGCLLLPYSIFGLMFGVGILGFTPFLSAIAYLRNGYRVNHRKATGVPGGLQVGALLLGSALALGAPALLSVTIHKIVWHAAENVMHGNPQQVSAATHRLRLIRYFAGAEMDKMADAYASEWDPERKQIIKDSYRQITGEEIETRLRSLD